MNGELIVDNYVKIAAAQQPRKVGLPNQTTPRQEISQSHTLIKSTSQDQIFYLISFSVYFQSQAKGGHLGSYPTTEHSGAMQYNPSPQYIE